MDANAIREEMKTICKSQKWREIAKFVDEGFRGVFVILRILDERDEKITAGDLARETNVSTARVASALNALEKKNYVKREVDDSDARKVVVRLTKDGKKAVEERKARIEEIVSPLFGKLTDEETINFFDALKKLLS